MQLPTAKYFILSVPEPHVLLITINRPKQYNALNPEANFEMSALLDWAEATDEIWCIVVSQSQLIFHLLQSRIPSG